MSHYDTNLDKNNANYVPLTPLSFLERAKDIYPDYEALIYEDRSYTWDQIYKRCTKFASALEKIGIKKDKDESTVLTKLNEENLIQIAQAGNGTYTKTRGLNLNLRKILDRINQIEKTTLKKDRYSTYDDQFQWFLLPALLLLLLDFVIFEKRGKIDDQIILFK